MMGEVKINKTEVEQGGVDGVSFILLFPSRGIDRVERR